MTLASRSFSEGALPELALQSFTKRRQMKNPNLWTFLPPPRMPACFYKSSASPPPNQALHVFCGNGSCGPRPRMPVSSQEHSFAERVINQNVGPNETSDRTLTVTKSAQAPLSGNERQEQGSRCPKQQGDQLQPPFFPLFPPVCSPISFIIPTESLTAVLCSCPRDQPSGC